MLPLELGEATALLPLAIAVTVFVAVSLLAFGLHRRPVSGVQARLAALRQQVGGSPQTDMSAAFVDRAIAPLLEGLARRVAAVLPSGIIAKVRQALIMAGEPVPVPSFLTIWLILSTALPGALIAATMATGNPWDMQQVLWLAVMAAVGVLLPVLWLRIAVQRRQKRIAKALPDTLDLITTCVEAGLGLDAALTRIAHKIKGPLADELSHTLREMSMGRLRRDALHDLGERTGVADILSFVRALIQAEQMGVSIGQVLRVQADQMRVKRRQRAEQAAYQAPVKMLFPLVLFIFPSLLVVVLGPAIIRITEFLPQVF